MGRMGHFGYILPESVPEEKAVFCEISWKYNNCTQVNREEGLQSKSCQLQFSWLCQESLDDIIENPAKTVIQPCCCQDSTIGNEQKRVYPMSYFLMIVTKMTMAMEALAVSQKTYAPKWMVSPFLAYFAYFNKEGCWTIQHPWQRCSMSTRAQCRPASGKHLPGQGLHFPDPFVISSHQCNDEWI